MAGNWCCWCAFTFQWYVAMASLFERYRLRLALRFIGCFHHYLFPICYSPLACRISQQGNLFLTRLFRWGMLARENIQGLLVLGFIMVIESCEYRHRAQIGCLLLASIPIFGIIVGVTYFFLLDWRHMQLLGRSSPHVFSKFISMHSSRNIDHYSNTLLSMVNISLWCGSMQILRSLT